MLAWLVLATTTCLLLANIFGTTWKVVKSGPWFLLEFVGVVLVCSWIIWGAIHFMASRQHIGLWRGPRSREDSPRPASLGPLQGHASPTQEKVLVEQHGISDNDGESALKTKGCPNESRSFSRPIDTGYVDDGEEYELVYGDPEQHNQEPSLYARFPNGVSVPFEGHRVYVKVQLQTYNFLEEPLFTEQRVLSGGRARIFLNHQLVYGFFFRNPEEALERAKTTLRQLKDFGPIKKWCREEIEQQLVGRKIFFRECPAIVESFIGEEGSVWIRADTPSGAFPIPCCARDQVQAGGDSRLKEDLLSPHIWWWRSD